MSTISIPTSAPTLLYPTIFPKNTTQSQKFIRFFVSLIPSLFLVQIPTNIPTPSPTFNSPILAASIIISSISILIIILCSCLNIWTFFSAKSDDQKPTRSGFDFLQSTPSINSHESSNSNERIPILTSNSSFLRSYQSFPSSSTLNVPDSQPVLNSTTQIIYRLSKSRRKKPTHRLSLSDLQTRSQHYYSTLPYHDQQEQLRQLLRQKKDQFLQQELSSNQSDPDMESQDFLRSYHISLSPTNSPSSSQDQDQDLNPNQGQNASRKMLGSTDSTSFDPSFSLVCASTSSTSSSPSEENSLAHTSTHTPASSLVPSDTSFSPSLHSLSSHFPALESHYALSPLEDTYSYYTHPHPIPSRPPSPTSQMTTPLKSSSPLFPPSSSRSLPSDAIPPSTTPYSSPLPPPSSTIIPPSLSFTSSPTPPLIQFFNPMYQDLSFENSPLPLPTRRPSRLALSPTPSYPSPPTDDPS